MRKIVFSYILVLFFISCKQDKKDDTVAVVTEIDFNAKKLPTKQYINTKAKEVLKDWTEYNAFETSFEAVYKAENKEDISIIVEDLIEKQKLLAASSAPELFDKNHIKSRLKVCKTYILKLKASLEYGIEIQPRVIELLDAYNALRNQYNVTANSVLDTNLILELDE